MTGAVEGRLAKLGIELPEPMPPIANYVPFAQGGNLIVIAGQGPAVSGKYAVIGKLGTTVSVEEGYRAARLCFINVLAHLKAACGGELDRVGRVLRVGGFIAATPDFTQHGAVMDGASDLAVAAFEDLGRHARTSISAASLPLDVAVLVEAMFWIV